jgi:pimeloyl-ACP methyl ester carboxylesterase
LNADSAHLRQGERHTHRRTTLLMSVITAIGLTAAVLAGGAAANGSTIPPGLRTATIDGARIAYRELNPSARGTPLLLIIGYGSTMAEWDPTFIERLAAHRRVIVFDNRGIGDSTGSVRGLTIRTMADDASGLIRTLRLGRTDVLGWSMGGFIAQQLALQEPRQIRRLILASTDPGSAHTITGKPAVIDVLTNPDSTPSEKLPILFPADQQSAGQIWLQAVGSQPGITAADFATPTATLAAQKTATTTDWLRRAEGTYADLPRLRAPTLIAYGADDVIVPPADAKLLITRIPHATGLRFSDAGHAFLFQQPIKAAAAFATFLDRDHAG